jgi:GTPase involved in cell partitioning and DNA repair
MAGAAAATSAAERVAVEDTGFGRAPRAGKSSLLAMLSSSGTKFA